MCKLCRKSLERRAKKLGLYGELFKLIKGKPFKDQRQTRFILAHKWPLSLAEIGVGRQLHQKIDAQLMVRHCTTLEEILKEKYRALNGDRNIEFFHHFTLQCFGGGFT